MSSDWYEKKQNEYTKSDVVTSNLIHHDYSIGKNTAINKFKNDYKYQFKNWDKEAVLNRQKVLLELAFETWKFNDNRIDKQIILKENE
jgi:hypothetical protein